MIILGLTGSIGMGKSTAAAMLTGMGIPTYDSDSAVHSIFGPNGPAVEPIKKAFPNVIKNGEIDREALGNSVFSDETALKALEEIVHPLVRVVQDTFLLRNAARRATIVALDIPLLFELRLHVRCDVSVVVSAPSFLQRARVLSRPGMTQEKFLGILARQMPDAEKCRRADFVVSSGHGKRETLRQLNRIVKFSRQLPATHWPPDPFADRAENRWSLYARNSIRH